MNLSSLVYYTYYCGAKPNGIGFQLTRKSSFFQIDMIRILKTKDDSLGPFKLKLEIWKILHDLFTCIITSALVSFSIYIKGSKGGPKQIE